MAKNKKTLTTVLLIVLTVIVVLSVRFIIESKRGGISESIYSRSKGNKDASVKIVEFIDFECPACAFGAKFLSKFIEEQPDAIYLEMKYFPLKMHRHAFEAARFADCAARQGKFWPYHDKLVEQQDNWKKLTDAKPAFHIMAQETLLDEKKLSECLENPEVDVAIQQDLVEGQKMGVQSTPTYIVNGQVFVGVNNLKAELKKLLKIDVQ